MPSQFIVLHGPERVVSLVRFMPSQTDSAPSSNLADSQAISTQKQQERESSLEDQHCDEIIATDRSLDNDFSQFHQNQSKEVHSADINTKSTAITTQAHSKVDGDDTTHLDNKIIISTKPNTTHGDATIEISKPTSEENDTKSENKQDYKNLRAHISEKSSHTPHHFTSEGKVEKDDHKAESEASTYIGGVKVAQILDSPSTPAITLQELANGMIPPRPSSPVRDIPSSKLEDPDWVSQMQKKHAGKPRPDARSLLVLPNQKRQKPRDGMTPTLAHAESKSQEKIDTRANQGANSMKAVHDSIQSHFKVETRESQPQLGPKSKSNFQLASAQPMDRMRQFAGDAASSLVKSAENFDKFLQKTLRVRSNAPDSSTMTRNSEGLSSKQENNEQARVSTESAKKSGETVAPRVESIKSLRDSIEQGEKSQLQWNKINTIEIEAKTDQEPAIHGSALVGALFANWMKNGSIFSVDFPPDYAASNAGWEGVENFPKLHSCLKMATSVLETVLFYRNLGDFDELNRVLSHWFVNNSDFLEKTLPSDILQLNKTESRDIDTGTDAMSQKMRSGTSTGETISKSEAQATILDQINPIQSKRKQKKSNSALLEQEIGKQPFTSVSKSFKEQESEKMSLKYELSAGKHRRMFELQSGDHVEKRIWAIRQLVTLYWESNILGLMDSFRLETGISLNVPGLVSQIPVRQDYWDLARATQFLENYWSWLDLDVICCISRAISLVDYSELAITKVSCKEEKEKKKKKNPFKSMLITTTNKNVCMCLTKRDSKKDICISFLLILIFSLFALFLFII